MKWTLTCLWYVYVFWNCPFLRMQCCSLSLIKRFFAAGFMDDTAQVILTFDRDLQMKSLRVWTHLTNLTLHKKRQHKTALSYWSKQMSITASVASLCRTFSCDWPTASVAATYSPLIGWTQTLPYMVKRFRNQLLSMFQTKTLTAQTDGIKRQLFTFTFSTLTDGEVHRRPAKVNCLLNSLRVRKNRALTVRLGLVSTRC